MVMGMEVNLAQMLLYRSEGKSSSYGMGHSKYCWLTKVLDGVGQRDTGKVKCCRVKFHHCFLLCRFYVKVVLASFVALLHFPDQT